MEHQNKLIYGGLLAISALTGCTEPVTEKPLNIVYIMTDDHTAQMMSCYDKRYMDTPNLDRIANEGVRFTNSFVANSLSGPSRACMLTGKHSCENKSMITLPAYLIHRSKLFRNYCRKRVIRLH